MKSGYRFLCDPTLAALVGGENFEARIAVPVLTVDLPRRPHSWIGAEYTLDSLLEVRVDGVVVGGKKV